MDLDKIFTKKSMVIIQAHHDNFLNSVFIGDMDDNVIFPKYEIVSGITKMDEIDDKTYPREVQLLISCLKEEKIPTFFEFLELLISVKKLGYKLYFSFCGYMLNPLREDKNFILYAFYKDECYNELVVKEIDIKLILENKSQFSKAGNIYYCLNDDNLYLLAKENWHMNELIDDGSILYNFLKKNIEDEV